MIRQRPIDPPDQEKKSKSQMKISDFIFTVINRDNPFQSLYQDRKTPAIGQYNPRFDLLKQGTQVCVIREESPMRRSMK
jgi:hypothetical protein